MEVSESADNHKHGQVYWQQTDLPKEDKNKISEKYEEVKHMKRTVSNTTADESVV